MTADIEPCFAMVWHAGHNFDEQSNEALMMACHAKAISQKLVKILPKSNRSSWRHGFYRSIRGFILFKRIGMNRQLLGAPELLRREAAQHQGL